MQRTSDICPVCGKDYDDHTVRDYRDHLKARMGEVNQPYAEYGNTNWIDIANLADRLEIAAAVFNVPEPARIAGLPSYMPGLHYRFFAGTESVADVQIVLSDEAIRSARLLTSEAIDGALKHARRLR